jgi:hypothetical protein
MARQSVEARDIQPTDIFFLGGDLANRQEVTAVAIRNDGAMVCLTYSDGKTLELGAHETVTVDRLTDSIRGEAMKQAMAAAEGRTP